MRSIRRITPDEIVAYLTVLGDAYGLQIDEHYIEAWRSSFDYDRNIALFLDGHLVGTATSGLVEVTTPGPIAISSACTGNLAVVPGAPVPGLAREIFARQCSEHRAEGFPFIVFSVTKAMRKLHLRLGSAPATESMTMTLIPGHRATPTGAAEGLIEELSVLSPELYNIHRRVAATTVGMIVRERAWMDTVRRLSAAQGSPNVWVHRQGGHLGGYAVWRRTGDTAGQPVSIVVDEFITDNPSSCRELVRELLTAEAERIEIHNWRLDDPIRWWFGDRVSVERGGLQDALWIRLLDVPGALAARQYLVADRLTLEVADRFLPEAAGRFSLDVSPDGVSCQPTDASPDVCLGTGPLAAMYLGATDAMTLIESGLAVASSDEMARRLASLFRTERPPWSGADR
ncbi:MAG: GNAT family N-acetyltransferase [Pseudonocardiaceae bacterium]